MLKSNLVISTSEEDALDLFMALTQEIRCWASVVDGGPALVRRWAGVPCLLGGYPLCVGSVLVHVFGAVPALPQH